MKLSGAAQAELIKVGAFVVGAGLLAWGGYRLWTGATASINDAVSSAIESIKATATGALDAVIEAPSRAMQAVKQTATAGGQTWQEGYTDKIPPGAQTSPTSPYEGRYSNPLVNDQGMDFGLF